MQNKKILLGLITSLILRAQCEISERETNPIALSQTWQCDGITGHDISPFGRRWCLDVLPDGGGWWDGIGSTVWKQLGPRKYFCNDGIVNYEREECCFNRYYPSFYEPHVAVFSMSRDQNYREKTCVHGTCQAPGLLDDCKCPPGYHSTDENQRCNSACDLGMWGQDCKKLCSQHCSITGTLRRRWFTWNPDGVTLCNRVSGACECKDGFDGYNYDKPEEQCEIGFEGQPCHECKAGYWGHKCSQTCFCSSRGTRLAKSGDPTLCNNVDGSCLCKIGFEGYSCDNSIPPCPPGTYGLQGIRGECKPCHQCGTGSRPNGETYETNCNADPWYGECKEN